MIKLIHSRKLDGEIMKTNRTSVKTLLTRVIIGLALLAGGYQATAQTAQFFRMAGPTAVTITKFRADGTMIWSGATPGATYTVQMVTALPGENNWVDYNQIVAAAASAPTSSLPSTRPPGWS